MLIVCPAANPVVAVQENCPAVPVRFTPDSDAVVDVVAAFDSVTVLPKTDDTVVDEGTPVPVTAWPAPTRALAAVSVTDGLPLVVLALAVNTPTLDIVRLLELPGKVPNSTGVVAVEVM
jgi:hypothetical protein